MIKQMLMIAVCAVTTQMASADILTENFEAAFPAWESGWFGANSNAQNVYGIGGGRGNNPDGLWIQDDTGGDEDIRIVFNNAFALSLTSLSFDVAGYSVPTRLEFFDANNVVLSDTLIILTGGGTTDPGIYVNYSVASITGIGGFRFYAASPEGNTSIDNIVANGTFGQAVPEPATWFTALPLLAIAGLYRRRMKRRA